MHFALLSVRSFLPCQPAFLENFNEATAGLEGWTTVKLIALSDRKTKGTREEKITENFP